MILTIKSVDEEFKELDACDVCGKPLKIGDDVIINWGYETFRHVTCARTPCAECDRKFVRSHMYRMPGTDKWKCADCRAAGT